MKLNSMSRSHQNYGPIQQGLAGRNFMQTTMQNSLTGNSSMSDGSVTDLVSFLDSGRSILAAGSNACTGRLDAQTAPFGAGGFQHFLLNSANRTTQRTAQFSNMKVSAFCSTSPRIISTIESSRGQQEPLTYWNSFCIQSKHDWMCIQLQDVEDAKRAALVRQVCGYEPGDRPKEEATCTSTPTLPRTRAPKRATKRPTIE